jgi:hypothetical protein
VRMCGLRAAVVLADGVDRHDAAHWADMQR